MSDADPTIGSDHYDVLDVDRDASAEEIERAYREKVKQHHPDRSDAPNARERFKRVREAKETLLDPEARQRYDRTRHREQEHDLEDEGAAHHGDSSTQSNCREHPDNRTEHYRTGEQSRTRRTTQQDRDRADSDRSRSWSHRRHRTKTGPRGKHRSSRDGRSRQTAASMRTRVRTALRRMRGEYNALTRRVRAQFSSAEAVRQLLTTVVTAPTTLRLGVTVLLAYTANVSMSSIGFEPAASSRARFAIVLGSLVASYVGYAMFRPLPFETPRSRGRFAPAGRTPVWPAVALHLTGAGLLGLAAVNGTFAAGIGFTIVSGMYAGLVFGGCAIAFTVFFLAVHQALGGRFHLAGSAKTGGLMALIAGAFVLFSQYAGDATLRSAIQSVTTLSTTAPWIPAISVGPFLLGLFANFLLAVVVLGCVVSSVVATWWYLTVVPWRDRRDHGYRIRPTSWNLGVATPLVVLGWMVVTDVSVVDLWLFDLTRLSVWAIVFASPTVLVGAYAVRRWLEPQLQQRI